MDDAESRSYDDGIMVHHENSTSFCQSSSSEDLRLDHQFRKNTACMHTHICHHTHTQVFAPASDGGKEQKQSLITKPRKTSGNKEAVRKYREKKKAHAAYLEEEVKKLRALNQQLVGKLQSQACLEAEVLRLKSLLLELKDRIGIELGAILPSQRTRAGTFKEGDGNPPFGCHANADRNPATGGQEGTCTAPVVSNCAVNINGDDADCLGNIGGHHEQMIPSSNCGG
ncbi:basic leucine zipper 23-like [Nymphaea colorata]|uniref:BZIP domain-containing protein n=1 Tax=Nymphaea colorata TaxID=210225 RepID=A0A5K1GAJ8_9MAGN|nr:basic leucine zipper 23-like [Nymphaea colorata]XP_031494003.1 basic leucine zipper 23-like [Nymphaea colorata]XP_031494004.1 basic leucine zipper 23-like [Nymphaea colorata]